MTRIDKKYDRERRDCMSEKVTFKYFEGRDVEQFTFYRIPKQLFTVSFFKSLSSDAKILYGLMLDRISLSLKNNWFDEKNRAYIYFSLEEVMDCLGCGKNKAIKCMKELDDETGIGLTQKRRQGFGKSNMIYVKTFLVESPEAVGQDQDQKNGTVSTGADCGEIPMTVIDQLLAEGYGLADSEESPEDLEDSRAVEHIYGIADPASGISPRERMDTRNQTSVEDSENRIALMDDEKQTSLPAQREEKTAGFSEETELTDIGNPENEALSRDPDRYFAGSAIGSGLTACISGACGPDKKFDNQTCGGNAPDTEVYFSNFKKFKNQTSRSPKNKLLEVYFSNPNYNNYNKTEYNNLKSYLIVSGDIESEGCPETDGDRYDTIRWDQRERASPEKDPDAASQELGAIYALIRDNISLDDLLAARERDRDLIQEIYSLIVEMVACRSTEVVIASSRYPTELVRSRFLKLRYDHILYVMDCLEKNTGKVRNIRKYLLAALFNAPATMDGYYRAEVRHDMPELAQGTPRV